MPGKGREHFDTYTEQNRVKHAILTKYLSAYLQVLRGRVDAVHYIDGFAGAGTYEGEHAGSPLYAIDLLSRYPRLGTASLVESDAKSFTRLQTAVATAPGLQQLVEEPLLRHAEFAECLDEVLSRPVFIGLRRVATFAFVDPCGLKGLNLEDLSRILRPPFSECLVFLNYDGLARWAGAVRSGSHARERFERFFGGKSSAESALACLDSKDPSREGQLLGIYVNALLEDSGATFSLAFRFQSRDRKRTSHYLIHLSQHAVAFKIMKEVMRGESSGADDYGTFGFIPGDELAGQGELFRPNEERARTEILTTLRNGPLPASVILDDWPLRPSDMLITKEYREILLRLEEEQLVEVIERSSGRPAPAAGRPTRSGKPTFGKKYDVRLRP